MSAPRLSEEQKNKIFSAYMAGNPVSEIARQFNVSPTYPTILAMRRGAPKRYSGAKAALIRSVGPKRVRLP